MTKRRGKFHEIADAVRRVRESATQKMPSEGPNRSGGVLPLAPKHEKGSCPRKRKRGGVN